MITREQIITDPTWHETVAHEPDDAELTEVFKRCPSSLAVVTPSRVVFKEDFIAG